MIVIIVIIIYISHRVPACIRKWVVWVLWMKDEAQDIIQTNHIFSYSKLSNIIFSLKPSIILQFSYYSCHSLCEWWCFQMISEDVTGQITKVQDIYWSLNIVSCSEIKYSKWHSVLLFVSFLWHVHVSNLKTVTWNLIQI